MRVLLDENVDQLLKSRFDRGVEVLTVDECGWKGMKNGYLKTWPTSRARKSTLFLFKKPRRGGLFVAHPGNKKKSAVGATYCFSHHDEGTRRDASYGISRP